MPRTSANGIEICYETFGSADDPPLLLVMGLGAQMIQWPDAFCEQLTERGFTVTRFDNRDVGESTWFDDAEGQPPYTLDDMADDAAGLLEALDIPSAHIVGASMGGMIAQLLAIRHPQRVRSLCSIMSTPGGEAEEPPASEVMEIFTRPAPTNRDEAMDAGLEARRVIGSTAFPVDEATVRELAGRAYDRAFHPAGMMRQLAAIMASPGRAEALSAVSVPTVVIHGSVDPLVRPSGGTRTAEAVPGAELVVVEGMGHDLPEGAWPVILDAIETNAAKAHSVA